MRLERVETASAAEDRTKARCSSPEANGDRTLDAAYELRLE